MSEEPILKPEEVASVLESDEPAAAPLPETSSGGPHPYSLREPVSIQPQREEEARRMIEEIAGLLERILSKDLGGDIALEVEGFRQRRCSTVIDEIPDPVWLLHFQREAAALALALHPSTALSLIERSLGGTGSAPESLRGPTPLERRVMDKLSLSLREQLNRHGGFEFTVAGAGVGRVPPELAAPGETVGTALVRVRVSDNEQTCLLVITPSMLQGVGETEEKRSTEPGPLLGRLGRLVVEVRAVLAGGQVALDELSGLQAGDVLRLDAREDETPLELRIQGETVFRGRVHKDPAGGATFKVEWRRGRNVTEETDG